MGEQCKISVWTTEYFGMFCMPSRCEEAINGRRHHASLCFQKLKKKNRVQQLTRFTDWMRQFYGIRRLVQFFLWYFPFLRKYCLLFASLLRVSWESWYGFKHISLIDPGDNIVYAINEIQQFRKTRDNRSAIMS